VRGDGQEADAARRSGQRRARVAARVRLVGVERAERAGGERAVARGERASGERRDEIGKCEALTAGEEADPGGQARAQLVRALLPDDQRQERLAVDEERAVADRAVRGRGRTGSREGDRPARRVAGGRRGVDRDVVR